jgi:hypothetical protein
VTTSSRITPVLTVALAVLGHPEALILPAIAADAAEHVGGISPMLEVVTACCRQGGLQLG